MIAKTLIRNGYKVNFEPGSKMFEIIKSFKPNIIFNVPWPVWRRWLYTNYLRDL